MKKIEVYYFSGTGNTEIVADLIKEGLANQGNKVSLLRIEDIAKERRQLDLSNYDMIGIGCPVIGFGTPYIVRKFLKLFPEGKGRKVFIFRTAGGVAPVNYNASRPIIKELMKRGYDVFYERIFAISSNWTSRFEDEIVRQLYEATVRKTSFLCQEVLEGKIRKLKTDTKLQIEMGLARRVFADILRLTGKDMAANSACSGCGTCIRNCPMDNIVRKNGKIKFSLSCTNCMRCVYACPNGAIYYRFLKFFPVKGGYNIRKILNESIAAHEIDENKVPPFFQKYVNEDNY
jgi:Flavodoxins